MRKVIVGAPLYANAHEAIREGNARGPACVGWSATARGWQVYDPSKGCPEGLEPELLCLRSGRLPLPLSETGTAIVQGLVALAA